MQVQHNAMHAVHANTLGLLSDRNHPQRDVQKSGALAISLRIHFWLHTPARCTVVLTHCSLSAQKASPKPAVLKLNISIISGDFVQDGNGIPSPGAKA